MVRRKVLILGLNNEKFCFSKAEMESPFQKLSYKFIIAAIAQMQSNITLFNRRI